MTPTPVPLNVFTCPLEGVNLIEASAGTGKTWTICGLYLRLLLERELTVQQILVVTFTNSATAELRTRIRTRIVELLDCLNGVPTSKPDPFIRTLAGNLLGRPSATAQNLTARLELALHSFDEAAIFTIHGFCQRALADNPFAAGLPMRTELVESDHDLLMETVHDFWRRHVAHDATPEFARYLAAKGDSPQKYAKLLRRHLAKPLARHVWPPNLDDPPPVASTLDAPYRTACTHWLTNKTAVCAQLTADLAQLNGNTYKHKSLTEAAVAWDVLCRDNDPLAAVDAKAHLLRAGSLARKTNKKCITPTHDFFLHAEAYLAQRDDLEQSLFRARCRLIQQLFTAGSKQLRLLKRSRKVVAFNDMLANVHERLHHADYPWLPGAIRTRFPAALIDEFQDTDPLQLAIFQAIYGTPDSRVFLVGDPKQAIYSFRHADLHSYLRATRWADRHWTLTDNQRSSQALLTALNALFGRNGTAFVLPEVAYRPVEFGDKPRAPFVDDSEPRAPLQVWRLPDAADPLPKPRARAAAVDATAAEIARLLTAAREGHIKHDDHELKPRDIAVLVRSRALGSDVKRALAHLNVGAVELSRDSIFGTSDARDWEILLTAIASPTRDGLLRAALATEIIGLDASTLEATVANEAELSAWITKFMEYHALWVNRGFGIMVRQVFTNEAIAKRLLARPDGERRLTNSLHITEELQKAAESHPSPDALLHWFKTAQQEEHPVDAAQLRLESDQNLVQIVTIHTSKGLEYPIVFCPFLGDGGTKAGGATLEGLEYHDGNLEPMIDFIDYEDDPKTKDGIKAKIKLETAAETVRLIYVALTRAVHRCYLVMGPYQAHYKDEAARSMLNWLVAGASSSPEDWFKSTRSTQQLDGAWADVATASGGAMIIDALPTVDGLPVQSVANTDTPLSTPTPPGPIAASWRLSSYSGLSHRTRSDGARVDTAAGDHDARIIATPMWGPPPPNIPADDILRFPRGPDAGDCIHAVFENIDFTDPSGVERAIANALTHHTQSRAGDPASLPPTTLTRMLQRLVKDVTATVLPTASTEPASVCLASIPLSRRLTELEFNLPVPHLSAGALNMLLEKNGYDVPALSFGALEGYLKGFIDLVFEHEGRFFILDWKSNHLGYSPSDYGRESIERSMADHGYHLQYLLYTLAVDRYLQLRIPDYRYDTHFGGVLYLFVRGVRPDRAASPVEVPVDGHATPGVFFHRPDIETIRELNHLLGASPVGLTDNSAVNTP